MIDPTNPSINSTPVDFKTVGKPNNGKPNKASKKTNGIGAFALRAIKALGLIFLNIVTLGFINFSPTVRDMTKETFCGKEITPPNPFLTKKKSVLLKKS